MLIGELAERVGLHPVTIRRLERKGVLQSKRDRNGWRVYEPEAVEALQRLYRRGQDKLGPETLAKATPREVLAAAH